MSKPKSPERGSLPPANISLNLSRSAHKQRLNRLMIMSLISASQVCEGEYSGRRFWAQADLNDVESRQNIYRVATIGELTALLTGELKTLRMTLTLVLAIASAFRSGGSPMTQSRSLRAGE